MTAKKAPAKKSKTSAAAKRVSELEARVERIEAVLKSHLGLGAALEAEQAE